MLDFGSYSSVRAAVARWAAQRMQGCDRETAGAQLLAHLEMELFLYESNSIRLERGSDDPAEIEGNQEYEEYWEHG